MSNEFHQLPRLTAADLAKNVRFLAACVGHYLPARFLKYALKERYPDFETNQQDICIEGVQRSGNTYFVAVFRHWNGSAQVAHHTHLAGTVKTALVHGVPTAVLIRRPDEAIASIIAWDSRLSVTSALISYILFYQALWKYSQSFVVLRFEDVTSHPDECVARINERFGTGFSHAPVTDPFRNNVFRNIEKSDQVMERDRLSSSLPNAEKAELKAQIEPLARSNWLYSPASAWYRKYEDLAGRREE